MAGRCPALSQRPDGLRMLGVRRAHVGNVGRSLTPVDVIHQILRRTLPRYEKLDLMILMVGASDAIEWMERKTPADITEASAADGSCFAENPDERFRWRSRKWAFKRFAGTLWRRVALPVRRRVDCGHRLQEFRRHRQQAKEWVREFPDPTPMLDHLEENLRRSVAVARAKGARVMLVRQPWFDKDFNAEEEAAMWSFSHGRLCKEIEARTCYTHSAVRELMGKVDGRTARVAGQLGLEHVNLMPILEASLENFYDFLHFTPAGAMRVAEHVAAAVLEPHLAPEIHALAAAVGRPVARTGIMVETA